MKSPGDAVSTSISQQAIAEGKITQYLNECTKQTKNFNHYKDRTLFQFPVDSLELYELIMELEELLDIQIDDSVLDGELTIGEIIEIILNPSQQ